MSCLSHTKRVVGPRRLKIMHVKIPQDMHFSNRFGICTRKGFVPPSLVGKNPSGTQAFEKADTCFSVSIPFHKPIRLTSLKGV